MHDKHKNRLYTAFFCLSESVLKNCWSNLINFFFICWGDDSMGGLSAKKYFFNFLTTHKNNFMIINIFEKKNPQSIINMFALPAERVFCTIFHSEIHRDCDIHTG